MEQRDQQSQIFFDALLSMDRIGSEMTLREIMAERQDFGAVEQAITEALQHIGTGWENGDYSLSQIYMSGVICEEIIDRLLPEYQMVRKNSPKIGIGVLIDHHALGKRIVKSVVQAEGFEIVDFGFGLSVTEMVEKTMANHIDVLLVSTLMLPSALKIKELRTQFDKLGLTTRLIVGTSLVTTAPAATMAPSSMVTPGSTVAWAPIQTLFPIRIGAGNISLRFCGLLSWLRVASTTLWPIRTPSPIKMPP